MFNKGIRELLDKLPDIGDIDPRKIRQLLTDAWIEIDVAKSFDPESWTIKRDELRKLASSLEIHAILASTEVREVKACAFVAAEALNISSQAFQDEPEEQWLLGSTRLFERFEASILYLIAGFDSNAAIAARNIETELSLKNTISSAELDLASTLVSYLRLQPLGISETQQIPEEDTSGSVAARARATLLQTINSAVYAHLNWLSVKTDTDDSIDLLDRVLRALSPADGISAYHADIYHLSTLLRAAIQQTRIRALRSLPGPNHSNDIFTSFLKSQAAVRPLVWPAALEYAHTSLPGPSHHAVVNVPTGSGKSSIADLAIAHSLSSGWVLYLAPTNALVGQIKRQIFSTFGTVKGVRLFDFRGGGEYGADPELLPGLTTSSKIIVMTPEKCSVLLRNNRELFADLSLCVIDEAHSLGEQSPRASVLEIVVSELILSSPNSKFILLSALIGNPESLSNWLANSTGKPSQVVSVPWRPTRTLRVLAGFEVSSLEKTAVVAMKELEDLPERRKKKKFSAQISFLASLQGEWQSNSIDDYRAFPTTINSTLEINRQKRIERNGYLNGS